MKCYIIYGSETLLLKPFLNKIDSNSICIRIYNNKVPLKKKNFFDIKFDGLCIEKLNKLIDEKIDSLKKIVFIGAAATLEKTLYMSNTSIEKKNILQTNIINYLDLVTAILPYMVKKKSGSFIYLSSFRAIKPTKGTLLYSSTKSFCETFFKGIGIEYGRLNITSHIIRMGAFDGKMLHDLGKKYIDKITKSISLNREGTPDELCKVLNFCENNPYSNSGIIEMNGGLNLEA